MLIYDNVSFMDSISLPFFYVLLFSVLFIPWFDVLVSTDDFVCKFKLWLAQFLFLNKSYSSVSSCKILYNYFPLLNFGHSFPWEKFMVWSPTLRFLEMESKDYKLGSLFKSLLIGICAHLLFWHLVWGAFLVL